MSEKNKFILLTIIICIMLLIGGYAYNNHKTKAETIDYAIENIEEYVSVWTKTNTDIKIEPSVMGETIGNYHWNIEIPVTYIDNDWAKIQGTEHYVQRDFISETPIDFIDRDVPSNNSIKSYMDYRFITSKSSDQYKLQEALAYTGDNGLRMVNGRYCIAVGSYYTTTIGQYLDIELENGKIIKAILADCKADIHTDATNRMNPNGSVIEFVVETENLDNFARKMGDISYVNGWNSKVVNIRIYDKVEEFK